MTTRIQKSKRMSQGVEHNGLIFLAGQVADDPKPDAAAQTEDILRKIDGLLGELGSDKSRLLSATIYLADIRHYEAMNGVWDAWVDPDNPPARATVQATLANPKFWVEIMVTAAK